MWLLKRRECGEALCVVGAAETWSGLYIPTFAFAWRATNLVKVESDRTNAGPIHLQTLTSANTSTYIRLLPPTFVPVAVTLGCC